MKHNKELNKCSECQFENGEHSFECSKYKEKDWVNKEWEKEFDEPHKKDCNIEPPPHICNCQKEIISNLLKEQKFALEKEITWVAGRLLRKELKAKDKEFIDWTKRLDKDGCHSVSTQKIRDWIKQN